jgi:hypothetical protein
MMNCKGFGRELSLPNFKVLYRHAPTGAEENHENFSQDSRSPGRDLNPRFPEYETGVLNTDHDNRYTDVTKT